MSSEQAKALAHELTMEYLKQHPDIMKYEYDVIVEKVADINQHFFNAIIKNRTLQNLY